MSNEMTETIMVKCGRKYYSRQGIVIRPFAMKFNSIEHATACVQELLAIFPTVEEGSIRVVVEYEREVRRIVRRVDDAYLRKQRKQAQQF